MRVCGGGWCAVRVMRGRRTPENPPVHVRRPCRPAGRSPAPQAVEVLEPRPGDPAGAGTPVAEVLEKLRPVDFRAHRAQVSHGGGKMPVQPVDALPGEEVESALRGPCPHFLLPARPLGDSGGERSPETDARSSRCAVGGLLPTGLYRVVVRVCGWLQSAAGLGCDHRRDRVVGPFHILRPLLGKPRGDQAMHPLHGVDVLAQATAQGAAGARVFAADLRDPGGERTCAADGPGASLVWDGRGRRGR